MHQIEYKTFYLIPSGSPVESYFWVTHNGAELDLLLFKDGRCLGVECKRMDAPRLTPSMRNALVDLGLDRLVVFYPGDHAYPLAAQVSVLPLAVLSQPDVDLFSEGI